MRFLLSAILGILVIAAFIAFFLLSSVVGYVDSPERLVESTHEGSLRKVIVEQTATYIADEVAADPTLANMSVEQLRAIVGSVVTQEWLDETLITAHGAVKRAVHGVEATAVLDLRGIKLALSGALSDLKIRAESNCAELLGADACSDADASRRMIAAFEARSLVAIGHLDNEIDLLQELQGADRENAVKLQRGLESIETVRMLSLIVLIMGCAVFIAVNARPLSRLLLATGTIASLSSAIYLVAIVMSESRASHEVSLASSAHSSAEAGTLAGRFVHQVIGGAVGGSSVRVGCIGGVGLVLIVLGIAARRRQRVLRSE